MTSLRKIKEENLKAAAAAILGFFFMLAGIWRGELAVVFKKAVIICLECIGIG